MGGTREPRDDIRKLERKLGFFTERGLHRANKASLTEHQNKLRDGIDDIKKQFIHLTPSQLDDSAQFDTAWRALYWSLGPYLWPEADANGGTASTPKDPELYPRTLVFMDDNETLMPLFRSLVAEKCATYYRNEMAKPGKVQARQLKRGDSMGQTGQTPHDSSPAMASTAPRVGHGGFLNGDDSDTTPHMAQISNLEGAVAGEASRRQSGRERTPRRPFEQTGSPTLTLPYGFAGQPTATAPGVHRPSIDTTSQHPRKRPRLALERPTVSDDVSLRSPSTGASSIRSQSTDSPRSLVVKLKMPGRWVDAERRLGKIADYRQQMQALYPEYTSEDSPPVTKQSSRFSTKRALPTDAAGQQAWRKSAKAPAKQTDNRSNSELLATMPTMVIPSAGAEAQAPTKSKKARRSGSDATQPKSRRESVAATTSGDAGDELSVIKQEKGSSRSPRKRPMAPPEAPRSPAADGASPVDISIAAHGVKRSRKSISAPATEDPPTVPTNAFPKHVDSRNPSPRGFTPVNGFFTQQEIGRPASHGAAPFAPVHAPTSLQPTPSHTSIEQPTPSLANTEPNLPPAGLKTSTSPPTETKPPITSVSDNTGNLIIVDWKDRNSNNVVSRLTRYTTKLWNALKEDMPDAFQGMKFGGINRSKVEMSAADVLERYGESISSSSFEECMEFLMDEAYGDEAAVMRTWNKATVLMC